MTNDAQESSITNEIIQKTNSGYRVEFLSAKDCEIVDIRLDEVEQCVEASAEYRVEDTPVSFRVDLNSGALLSDSFHCIGKALSLEVLLEVRQMLSMRKMSETQQSIIRSVHERHPLIKQSEFERRFPPILDVPLTDKVRRGLVKTLGA